MFNLLPESEKGNILREYKARRSIAVLIALFVVGLFAVISIFPSYVLTSLRVKEAERSIEAIRSSSIFSQEAELKEELSQIQSKLSVLNLDKKEEPLSNLFQAVFSRKDEGIRLSSIIFTSQRDDIPANLTVFGVAWAREDVASFVSGLREEVVFEQVDFPVSSLTKDKNAEFTINISGDF